MAIPIPKPDLADDLCIEAIVRHICVHAALDLSLPEQERRTTLEYRVPGCDQEWHVCEACAEELDRRLLTPSRYGFGKYDGRSGVGGPASRYAWPRIEAS